MAEQNPSRPAASEVAKAGGLPSLNFMQECTGIRRNTLDLWNKERPQLFDVMVLGCKAMLYRQQAQAPHE
jgi:hypothetical protein